MTKINGYMNKIAWVDLYEKKIEYQELDEEDALKFIGGRGLGGRILLKNGVGKDPLSPENPLIIMTGPLTGTDTPMSNRIVSVTRSPLTGFFADSHCGGYAGPALKLAGFDGMVLTGASEKPVHLVARNGEITIEDARGLWGKTTFDAYQSVKRRYGAAAVFYGIGPAGENLARLANIMHFSRFAPGGRASGRCGTGAVMGSKKVKGLVFLADIKKKPAPANRNGFAKALATALKKIRENAVTSPGKGGLSVYGTGVLVNVINELSGYPTRNAKETRFENAYYTSGENLRGTILRKTPTCYQCPVSCKRESEVKDGKFKHRSEGPEYESIWALGAMIGVGHIEAISYLNYLANLYGIDTIELGNTLAVAAEASERGLLKEKIAWGDVDKYAELVRKLAYREGEVGNLLAEGGAAAAEKLGAPELSMSVKGLSIPAYDPRVFKGMGLTYATSNRGACHLRAYAISSEVLGVPYKTDPLSYDGKVDLVISLERLFAFVDSLTVCKFGTFALTREDYAALYSTFTGVEITEDDIDKIGERIWTQERYFNQLHGFSRKDDRLPKRFFEERSASGEIYDREAFERMLDEYYQKHKYNSEGTVPEETLRELGIL
ncbi:MAG: aldehyde ferredoxin oxidoreductase family protein [Nitrososphaeria archaeon]|nr:aldehyde ferredoxin oxidoreductase family protein [Nitrososphaeria archaeon]